ncbi:MAG: SOS response-associated peptidase [Cyclobacteriaceae bacterium]|nr:SOS response-associated peptidase [Cyclobacteriaceae bacterium]
MCYEIRTSTLAKEKYVNRYGDSLDSREFDRVFDGSRPVYHASGFDHPDLPVITRQNPDSIQLLNWGLIPHWTKAIEDVVRIQNQTLNARVETLFEKPAFRESVVSRRCLVIADGFFEHHHKNGKAFPYHIQMKNNEPMTLAGIWDTWRGEGVERTTVSIVTTRANALMGRIHNNPKLSEGPRMPLILPKENEQDWLHLSVRDAKDLEHIVVPFDERLLEAYTVPKLKGKLAVGNTEKAITKCDYQELVVVQTGLF